MLYIRTDTTCVEFSEFIRSYIFISCLTVVFQNQDTTRQQEPDINDWNFQRNFE